MLSSSFLSIIPHIIRADEGQYSDDWWDENWNYRKELCILNPQESYQMNLTVFRQDGHDFINDGIVDCDNLCNEDFSDLRFFDGTQELDYWIESQNSEKAIVWVETSGTDKIYLYYGNQNASSVSSAEDTFSYYDDWTQENTYNWITAKVDENLYQWWENTKSFYSQRIFEIKFKMLEWNNGLYDYAVLGWTADKTNNWQTSDHVVVQWNMKSYDGATNGICPVRLNIRAGAIATTTPYILVSKPEPSHELSLKIIYLSNMVIFEWMDLDTDTVLASGELTDPLVIPSPANVNYLFIGQLDMGGGIFNWKSPTYLRWGNYNDWKGDNGNGNVLFETDSWLIRKYNSIEPSWMTCVMPKSPIADFSFNPLNPTINSIVEFSDLSSDEDGTVISWDWDFGNGIHSSEQNPQHIYSQYGAYKIKLVVTDDYGFNNSIEKNIYVSDLLPNEREIILYPSDDSTIAHRAPDTNYGTNEKLLARNEYGGAGSTGWAYDFLIKFDLSIIPEKFNMSSAELFLYYSENKDNDPVGRNLNLYRALTNWNQGTVTWNSQPNYTSQKSTYSTVPSSVSEWMKWNITTDVEDFISKQLSNFGWKITDENYWGQYDIPIIYFNSKEGSEFKPYLKIKYFREGSDNIPPKADFSWSDNELNVEFKDKSIELDGTIVSWSWDFGDGTYSTQQNPIHTYSSDGSYFVTLNIIDDSGDVDSETKSVIVSETKILIVYIDDDYKNTTEGWGVNRFDNIQDGIANVTEGGTVYVYNGIYYENIVVNRTVNIIGEDKVTTIIDGDGKNDVVSITAGDCSIENINIRNSGEFFSGIRLLSNRNTLSNNILYENYYGLWIEDFSNNTISECIISNNEGGIKLRNEYGTEITNNQILSNSIEGIALESSYGSIITDNIFDNNGITISGELSYWNTHTIDGNIANDKKIYYYKNTNGVTVPSDAIQVIIANCNDIEIKNINFKDSVIGVQIGFSSDIRIENNIFDSNIQSAIQLYRSDDNTIINNIINDGVGIDLWESNYNNILSNGISGTTIAINMYESEFNNIKKNTITNNYFAIWMHNYCNNNKINRNTISSNEHGGLWLMEGCSDNTISNNSIRNNGEKSPHKTNIYLFGGCTNNIFYGNTIQSNGKTGIYIEIDVIYELNNLFYNNNFIGNSIHAYDSNVNKWHNGAILGGNYWDDYTGVDANDDGIGDIPYNISGGDNADLYPFISQSGWNKPPSKPINPIPDNTASDILINNLTLNWNCSDPEEDIITYDIYFGTTNPPFLLQNDCTDRTYSLTTLDYDTTYYWKIVAQDENSHIIEGDIWSFTTENRPPNADFSWSPLSPQKYQEITFFDSSFDIGGSIVNWYWEFGDGAISNEQNPTHSYSQKGAYNIYLLVTDNDDAVCYKNEMIYIEAIKPTADFTYSPIDPTNHDSIQFTDLSSDSDGSIVNWTWNFGDSSYSTEKNPTHKFSNAGQYSVTLTVNDNDGAQESISYLITISTDIEYSEDFEEQLGGEWSTYSSSSIYSRNIRDSYSSKSGSYSWRMDNLQDGQWNLNELILKIKVIDATYLELNFFTREYSDENNYLPDSFTNHYNGDGVVVSNDGINWIKLWQYPEYLLQWTKYGPFDLSEKISINGDVYIKFQQYDNFMIDIDGILWDDISIGSDGTITLPEQEANEPPKASFTVSKEEPDIEETIQFTSTSTDSDGTIVTYEWMFGDGTTSFLQNPVHSYHTAGTYTISLKVTDNKGDWDSTSKSIKVGNFKPIARFSILPISPNTNTLISYIDESTDSDGNIVSWYWTFGDGAISNIQNPTHQYVSSGCYLIRLTVTDNKGGTGTISYTLCVYPNKIPNADIGGPYSARPNVQLTFDAAKSSDSDGSIVGYRWDFNNDGIYDTEWLSVPTITYSFQNIGYYNIRLQVKDDDGAFGLDSTYVSITSNAAPVAVLGNSYTGKVDRAINFDGSGSYDTDGSISGYRWDFEDDGAYDTGWYTSPTITHTYSTARSYLIKLQVKDNEGETSETKAPVSVRYNKLPVAILDNSYYGIVSSPVSFNGASSYDLDGAITGYRWDFENDGTYDTEWLTSSQSSYAYSYEGVFTVKLQVIDDYGDASTDTAVVVISQNIPPFAEAGGPYTGQENNLVTFDGSKSYDPDGTISSYRWDFENDGTYDTDWSSSPITNHAFNTGRDFIIKLQVKDNYGALDIDTAVVTIIPNQPPYADAGGSYSAKVNSYIIFDASDSNDSDGTIIGYRWDFNNDGNYDTGWNTNSLYSYTYSEVGVYTLKLQVKDDDNAISEDITTATILSNQKPQANAGGPYVGWINLPLQFDGSNSSDPDGIITGYRWDFNCDGTYDTDWITIAPFYTYTNPGSYTVRLLVRDDNSETDTDTASVTISRNENPIADAGGPYSSFINEEILFNGSGSYDTDGVITSYRWDFENDGLYDTNWLSSSSYSYAYALGGTYTVKLQVKDNHGSTDTNTTTVKVTDSHLRGLWHFDEGEGTTAYDSSDFGNNAEIIGASWNNSGKIGKSLTINNLNYVKAEGIKSSFDYFTISIWAKFNSISNKMPFISRQDGSGRGRAILSLENNEICTFVGGTKIGTGYLPIIDEWHHYLLTYSNGLLNIYIDSNLLLTNNVTEEDANGAYIFGSDEDLSKFFDGNIDEIAIWDRALAFYEIQNLYSIPNQPGFENPANQTHWVDPNIGRLSVIVSEPYEFEEPTIEETTINGITYDRVIQTGSESYGEPGEPSLPAKGAYILLPKGTDVSDITVVTSEKEFLGNGYYVEPVATPYPLDSDEIIYPIPNEHIYNSNEAYPGNLFSVVGTYSFRGYNILILTLHSVQYIPSTGEIFYYKDIMVKVETRETNVDNDLFRNLETDKLAIEGLVDNPGMSGGYQGSSHDTSLSGNYDMIIITTNSLKDGFEPLKQAHDSEGLKTLIYTTEDIYSQYPGVDNPEKIRNFITDAYNNMGIEYVLIGGDDDIIPARRLWVQSYPGGYTSNMPSDVYYSCLDGTFNYDGDSYWGEPNDGVNGGDVDLIAEVYVGRACVGNAAEVEKFVSKTIAYLETKDDEYLQEVLLVGEYLGFGGVSDYAGNAMDELVDGSSSSGYTTVGIPSDDYNINKLYDRDWSGHSWPKSELISRINSDIHIINHLGHANYQYNMKMYTSDINSLTNDKYCFIYSQGCMAGGFDNGDCIAEYFTIKTSNGAFAGIWNARYGWGRYSSTDGPSQRFDREFWDAVFGENLSTLGKANSDSKEDNLYRVSQSCMRWCYYELNLFGDPSLDFVDRDGGKPDDPDDDSAGHIDVSFYWGNDTLIGTDENVGNNSIASVEIGPLNPYTNISWYVVVDDGFNVITGPNWWFTVDAYDWDINRDGRVDDIDSELLISSYGESGVPGWIREDIIRDGTINIKDISTFVKYYGDSYILEFVKDNDEGSLTVTSVILKGIKWSELELVGAGNIQKNNYDVSVGDKIINCDGTLTLIYKPIETISWSWSFGEGSNPEEPDGQPPSASYDTDLNDDGEIDDSDLELISDHYGETGEPGWIKEDINKDGTVDYSDISVLVNDYNKENEEQDTDPENNQNNDNVNPGGITPSNSGLTSGGIIGTPPLNNLQETIQLETNEEDEKTSVSDNFQNNKKEISVQSIRSVKINGGKSSLISVDGDKIPDYIKDELTSEYISVVYTPGSIKSVTKNKEDDSITVTINVRKAEWIYIETVDEYPDSKITVKTSDGRIITDDMIWREKGKIYVLDDPDVEYQFIYYNIQSESATSESNSEISNSYSFENIILFVAIAAFFVIFLYYYKFHKSWNYNIKRTKHKIKEVDSFINDFNSICKNKDLLFDINKFRLLEMVYHEEGLDSITNKLGCSVDEVKSLADSLVNDRLMKYSDDDEVEITKKGIKYLTDKE